MVVFKCCGDGGGGGLRVIHSDPAATIRIGRGQVFA